MIYFPTVAPDTRVWSSEQQAIFNWFERGSGHLLVRARAGTGKTTTLVEGVGRAPERKICVAAFNKSIAEELQKRVPPNVKAATLHGLGFGIIRPRLRVAQVAMKGERAKALAAAGAAVVRDRYSDSKKPSDFSLSKIGTYCTWMREMYGEPKAKLAEAVCLDEMCAWISSLEAFNGDDFDMFPWWTFERCVEAAIEATTLAKNVFAANPPEPIDFADMLYLPLACNIVRPTYDLVVIDEGQDMTRQQLDLALAACRGRICLVGDDKQSIYGFRGADIGCLDRLKKQLDAQELGLTMTYRCPQAVVKLANAFVPDLRARDDAPAGEVHGPVASKELRTCAPGDFVLSRKNAGMVDVFLLLVRAGKKAYIKGSDIGKGLEQALRKFNSRRLPALKNEIEKWREANVQKITTRAKKVADKCERPAGATSSVWLGTQLVVATEASRRAASKIAQLEDECMMLDAFIDGSKDYDDLILRLQTSFADVPDPSAVMLSTVHKAKGLEADNVWLLGKTFRRTDEEEDNICYVAVTRAKKVLNLVEVAYDEFISEPLPPWTRGRDQDRED